MTTAQARRTRERVAPAVRAAAARLRGGGDVEATLGELAEEVAVAAAEEAVAEVRLRDWPDPDARPTY